MFFNFGTKRKPFTSIAFGRDAILSAISDKWPLKKQSIVKRLLLLLEVRELWGTQPNSTLAGLNRSILIIICERKFLLTLSTPSKRRVSASKDDYSQVAK